MNGTKGRIGRPAKLTPLERKERAKECQKRWRMNNREKINEYRRQYAKNHPNPERIMRERLKSAINLLNRFGYIDDASAERMRGQV